MKKTGPGSGVVSAGYWLRNLLRKVTNLHLTINTVPSLGIQNAVQQLTKCFEPQQNLRLGPLN